jgi:glycoside/pentoside/hexuronide:cation symporter, GPH family
MAEQSEQHFHQKLSVFEKIGYSGADAAANFVFMSMILYQKNFYTDVFGLSAAAAGAILLWPRLWDAVVDPIVGTLADRTNSRWGKFRPWILFTAVPWCVVMILAYTTPIGWGTASLIAYAAITNTLLMSIYSMNNMPYAALGGVMTGDVHERASLNSYRFVAVNAAQFIVGGFTLPLVVKFAQSHAGAGGTIAPADTQHGWQMTMGIWAVLCLVLFLFTFMTTRERIKPPPAQRSSPRQDFGDLLKNSPWIVMFFMTLVHFCILSFRGGALYDYYHHYANRAAMFDFVQKLGLVYPSSAELPNNFLAHLGDTLGYIVYGARDNLASSNVADVFNSIVNMVGTATTIVFIILTAGWSKKFGKKVIAVTGFGLATVTTFIFYLLKPEQTTAMVVVSIATAIVYAPTIALVWAIYADVADYSEWKTGRRFTGIVFATIGFALKSGLAVGTYSVLWIYRVFFQYDTKLPDAEKAIEGYHVCAGLLVAILFAVCTILLACYPLGKTITLQMADELAERRKQFSQSTATT